MSGCKATGKPDHESCNNRSGIDSAESPLSGNEAGINNLIEERE